MVTTHKQKGISLIITFFIMIIILVVVLSISLLLYSEIKIIRDIGNSTISLYAADSGIEKVLYYDRQVLPVIRHDEGGGDILASRGLCSMLVESMGNPNYCREKQNGATEFSIYCDEPTIEGVEEGVNCDPINCTGCVVSFDTDLGNTRYSVEATVNNSENVYLNIKSSGTFGGAGRKIEITSLIPEL